MPSPHYPGPQVYHTALATTFSGIEHHLSSPEARLYQYRGIKYASAPARFRQSKLWTSYSALTDASKFGPMCPQPKSILTVEEETFGPAPAQLLADACRKQSEFECLNLNITCPAGLDEHSQLPVMVWIHGGGDRGSGSSWAYDGGSLVKNSISSGKPIIIVTLNFRIGFFGFAASPQLLADNKAAGDEGVGNYGLHDQLQALAWIHQYISQFGGSPHNITLVGSTTGAADILSHLLSSHNQKNPLFHRAILQSPLVDPNPPSVGAAGSQLSRTLCSVLGGAPATPENLRAIPADTLANVPVSNPVTRVTNDGVWFRDGWAHYFAHTADHATHYASSRRSRSRFSAALHLVDSDLQPIIIGDSSPSLFSPGSSSTGHSSTLLSSWTPPLLSRRLKAVCQSISKATRLLSAYDLDNHHADGWSHDTDEELSEDPDELEERVKELIHDARIAWPTDCVANAALKERRRVWRYVFDEDGVEDVRCFFDNIPPVEPEPVVVQEPLPSVKKVASINSAYSVEDDEGFASGGSSCASSASSVEDFDGDDSDSDDGYWGGDADDAWGSLGSPYELVRNALQARWLTFAYGEAPWGSDGVYVFGPEGETGERSKFIFERRRRQGAWKHALEPLGMGLVWKVGVELCRGPAMSGRF